MTINIDTQQQQSPVLDVIDACHYVCIGKTTMYNLINKGEFAKRIRIGKNKVGFLKSDLDFWLCSRREA